MLNRRCGVYTLRLGGDGIGNGLGLSMLNLPIPCPMAGDCGLNGTGLSLQIIGWKFDPSKPMADAISGTIAWSAVVGQMLV